MKKQSDIMSIYQDDPNVFVKISRNALFTNRMHHAVKWDPLSRSKITKVDSTISLNANASEEQ
jgi:hypothetical protein